MTDRQTVVVRCHGCDRDTSHRYYMCDQDDWSLCHACFEKTACYAGVHGEGCSTLVANDGCIKPLGTDDAENGMSR